MLAALASADTATWVSILIKALAYGTTPLAGGSVLALVALREVGPGGRSALRRTALVSALAAALFSVLRVPAHASVLMGGTWDGAMDPAILRLVAESPLGESVALRLAGLALILCVARPSRAGTGCALLGVLLASASFAMRGHALGEPRMLLGGLITVHILGLCFWVGAFAPLARAARRDPPERAGALAAEFGTVALWAVGVLVAAGGLCLAQLGAARPAALASAYGQIFLVKLALFAGLLSLAALNKLALTPALAAAAPGAGARLRRSIGLETALVAALLVTTAALTTLSAPPGTHSGDLSSRAAPPHPAAQPPIPFGGIPWPT